MIGHVGQFLRGLAHVGTGRCAVFGIITDTVPCLTVGWSDVAMLGFLNTSIVVGAVVVVLALNLVPYVFYALRG